MICHCAFHLEASCVLCLLPIRNLFEQSLRFLSLLGKSTEQKYHLSSSVPYRYVRGSFSVDKHFSYASLQPPVAQFSSAWACTVDLTVPQRPEIVVSSPGGSVHVSRSRHTPLLCEVQPTSCSSDRKKWKLG